VLSPKETVPIRRVVRAALICLIAFSMGAAAESTQATETERTAGADTGTSSDGVAIPRALSAEDARLYREIFHLQVDGNWTEADLRIAELDNRLLMGHVLAQRYLHPTAYRSKFHELAAWLEEYADHPDARRIHRLARRRMPEGASPPKPPVNNALGEPGPVNTPVSDPRLPIPKKQLSDDQAAQLKKLKGRIASRIRRGWPTGAMEVLTSEAFKSLVGEAQFDEARARIASSYFAHGKDELALELAGESAERSGRLLPEAHWTTALAAWRLGEPDRAGRHFEALIDSPNASPWLRAAGAYWAARASLVSRHPERVNRLLEMAAAHPRTFYGLLAIEALDLELPFRWEHPPLAEDNLAALREIPALWRALALGQVGQPARADRELQRLAPGASPEVRQRVLALARALGLPATEMKLALKLAQTNGEFNDPALYPLPRWEPPRGYSVDRALIFAIMRKESKFKADANNKSGAGGLMQLMPRTAALMADRLGMGDLTHGQILDPELNIALGQAYLNHLFQQKIVGDNLFYLAAAYNGGPARLAKWLREIDFHGDPLLFIESIPSPETRFFIENVFASLWIYRFRLGQPTPSLAAVAAGAWPVYIPQDRNNHVTTDARN
jgi:soluble lytic murein transglycosylase-like protein